jgi:peptidoglycan/LPS O-acetylase OafA/YrhL
MMQDYVVNLDGLRATALLGVLPFHFDVLGVTGGFVRVDVFLLRSGFWCADVSPLRPGTATSPYSLLFHAPCFFS